MHRGTAVRTWRLHQQEGSGASRRQVQEPLKPHFFKKNNNIKAKPRRRQQDLSKFCWFLTKYLHKQEPVAPASTRSSVHQTGRIKHRGAAHGRSSCPGLLMEPLKVKCGIIKEGVLHLHLPSLRTHRWLVLALSWGGKGPTQKVKCCLKDTFR